MPVLKSGLSILAILLLVTGAIYWPGLQGVFLLDDIPNLNVLNQVSENSSFLDILILAGEGFAGRLGRPVSILSFLVQAPAWPDPYYFKLGNLFLHLANGLLVFLVVRKIIACARLDITIPYAPLIIAALWLIHPLQVSTVLYVVQRMTMLSTFFILAGIYCYLVGREKLQSSNSLGGTLLMLAAPFAGALLAVFSKENGALIFPYLAVLELTLLSNQTPSERIKRLRFLSVFLPLALGLLAFLVISPSFIAGYEQKPFSITQRLVTQPAVLTGYLVQTIAPLPAHLGLYHDDFPIYSQPMESVLAITGWVVTAGLLLLAIIKRSSWRYFSFAVLWFYAGHSLESTILPLEMYFEHRNYLPVLGPLLFIVYGLEKLTHLLKLNSQEPVSLFLKRPPAVQALLVISIMLAYTTITVSQTRLWAEPVRQAEAWYSNSPGSLLAQGNLVTILSNTGQSEQAFYYHQQFIDPESPSVTHAIRWLEFKCLLPEITLPSDELLAQSAQQAAHDYSAIFILNNLTAGVVQGICPALPASKLAVVMTTLLSNDYYSVSYPDLYQLYAILQASQGGFDEAAELASRSYQLRPDIDVALYRIAWLIQAERLTLARDELADITSNLTARQRSDSRLTNRINLLTSMLEN